MPPAWQPAPPIATAPATFSCSAGPAARPPWFPRPSAAAAPRPATANPRESPCGPTAARCSSTAMPPTWSPAATVAAPTLVRQMASAAVAKSPFVFGPGQRLDARRTLRAAARERRGQALGPPKRRGLLHLRLGLPVRARAWPSRTTAAARSSTSTTTPILYRGGSPAQVCLSCGGAEAAPAPSPATAAFAAFSRYGSTFRKSSSTTPPPACSRKPDPPGGRPARADRRLVRRDEPGRPPFRLRLPRPRRRARPRRPQRQLRRLPFPARRRRRRPAEPLHLGRCPGRHARPTFPSDRPIGGRRRGAVQRGRLPARPARSRPRSAAWAYRVADGRRRLLSPLPGQPHGAGRRRFARPHRRPGRPGAAGQHRERPGTRLRSRRRPPAFVYRPARQDYQLVTARPDLAGQGTAGFVDAVRFDSEPEQGAVHQQRRRPGARHQPFSATSLFSCNTDGSGCQLLTHDFDDPNRTQERPITNLAATPDLAAAVFASLSTNLTASGERRPRQRFRSGAPAAASRCSAGRQAAPARRTATRSRRTSRPTAVSCWPPPMPPTSPPE